MGTITERKLRSGKTVYNAQIRIKRAGLSHSEARNFDRKPAAAAWLKKRESELEKPGALEAMNRPRVTLGDAIDAYLKDSRKQIGKTKAQCLDLIRKHPLAEANCADIKSHDITAFADDMLKGWTPDGEPSERQPQTVGNYLSHLGAVFTVARPMWGFDLDPQAFRDAQIVVGRMGVTSRSKARDRRPTLDELDRLMEHFGDRSQRVPHMVPMQEIILFALFSTRRQDEIARIQWADYEPAHKRVMVRDMKHPGEKLGNDQWCDLPPEAQAVIDRAPRTSERIFPYTAVAISANFTRACQLLGIQDLHFHDLRHEGVSRLFEIGWDIPHVATVSGHRSWNSLKRYTQIRQRGDKYAGWKWRPAVSEPGLASEAP